MTQTILEKRRVQTQEDKKSKKNEKKTECLLRSVSNTGQISVSN